MQVKKKDEKLEIEATRLLLRRNAFTIRLIILLH